MSDITSLRVAQLFWDGVWKLHRLPKEVISDRGPQFMSNFMHGLSEILGIKVAALTAYHLQTDGQTEHVNQEVKQFLCLFINQRHPHFQHAAKINSRLPDTSFLQLTKDISKSQASVLFQLRSEHIPLRKYLFRIGKTDSPVCALCRCRDETVHHFLFDCPTHHHARFDLGHALGRHSKSLRYLLGNKKALKLLI